MVYFILHESQNKILINLTGAANDNSHKCKPDVWRHKTVRKRGFKVYAGQLLWHHRSQRRRKTTFLKILSGELEPTTGEISIPKKCRMSVLKQDQFQYDEYPVIDTVIMGNPRLYEVMKEKDALYEKPDFNDEDGARAAELEGEFAERTGGTRKATRGAFCRGWALR